MHTAMINPVTKLASARGFAALSSCSLLAEFGADISRHGPQYIMAAGAGSETESSQDSLHEGKLPTLIVFTHAGGLCKELWLPVWRRLLPQLPRNCHLLAMDAPGHSDAPLPPNKNAGRDWPHWYHSALVQAVHLHFGHYPAGSRLFGVGHSFGSIPLMQAAWAQGNPGSAASQSSFMPALRQLAHPLQHLLVLEPVLMPGDPGHDLHQENALWAHARTRTDSWPSTAAAQSYFSSRKPLQRWHPEALGMYAQVLTRGVEGCEGGVTLKCRREFEADCYRGYHRLWEAMRDETASGGGAMGCTGTVLIAERDDVFGHAKDKKWQVQGGHTAMFEGVAKRWHAPGGGGTPGAQAVHLPGCGHFAVQERPEAIAQHVLEMVRA